MDAHEITALEVQQRNKERVNLHLDGAYAFSITALEAARLRVGQRLTEAEVARLKAQAEVDRAYERTLRFLTYRPRSEAEVVKYLASKGVEPSVQAEILAKLRRLNLVDDEAFARFWIESREQSHPMGRMALRAELRLKGVRDETIERAMQTLDEEESAYLAARKQARRYADLSDKQAQEKLGAFLIRRGFPYSVARATVKRLVEESAAEGILKEEREDGV
ncbi:MAG: RecX family transcriptional regulator [Anaerolineae bacterium]